MSKPIKSATKSSILFEVSLPSTKHLLLTAEQLDTLASIIVGAECVQTNYERDEDGKYRDIKTLSTVEVGDLSLSIITNTEYQSIEFVTKIRNEKE